MPLVIKPTSEDSARLKPNVAANVRIRRGLSSADARHRLETLGSNAIADVSQHAVRRALGKLWAPVPWMLEAAILLQLFLGDYVEAGVVTLLLVANAAIGFFQEGRAQATHKISSDDPTRAGHHHRIRLGLLGGLSGAEYGKVLVDFMTARGMGHFAKSITRGHRGRPPLRKRLAQSTAR